MQLLLPPALLKGKILSDEGNISLTSTSDGITLTKAVTTSDGDINLNAGGGILMAGTSALTSNSGSISATSGGSVTLKGVTGIEGITVQGSTVQLNESLAATTGDISITATTGTLRSAANRDITSQGR